MYEKQTEEVIKERMLERIPSDVDKSEGSFVYDAIAPVAIELAQAYIELDGVLEKVFALTSYGEWLEKRAGEFGVQRKTGTKATGLLTVKGQDGKEIPEGTLFQTESGSQYRSLEKVIISNGKAMVKVEAVLEGSKYNIDKANMIIQMPVLLMGITSVTNEDKVSGGTDPETDDMLRERLLYYVKNLATSGNKNHYIQWAMKVEGVGDAKVFQPSPGKVEVVIVDTLQKAASDALVSSVKEAIEKERPVCVDVSVKSAKEVSIRIRANITLETGHDKNYIEQQFKNEVEQYMKSIAFRKKRISLASIIDVLMDIEGVTDCEGLYINDKDESIKFAEDEVAVLTEVKLFESKVEST